ncbi:MAG: phosphoribosylglycinamide formyltransferase [Devosiaceae bacterium]|nr:phosphoribosylglycinamide formyltransferase [Devosiaceae bacterium]
MGAGKKNTVIFISGRGSNMEQLIKASLSPNYPAKIIGIISNKPDAKGLEIAKAHNIKMAIISPKDFSGKKATDEAISKQLEQWNTDIICLAGYMRLLGKDFCKKWQGKIINIHPSLLPKYKGLNTHQRALEAGEIEHGCTVHFVTAEMDEGSNIGQVIVPIEAGDDAQALEKRVLKAEHHLYAWALEQVALDKIKF